MKRAPAVSLLALFLVGLSGPSRPARAATIAEVNALMAKANAALKQEKKGRAAKFQEAVEICREALAVLEKVPRLSEEARDKKATQIMSMIYWCRKMTPLDLYGRQLTSGSRTNVKPTRQRTPPGGGGPVQETRPAKQTEFDRIIFERTQKYAKRRPEDLEGILLRYEGIAASFPKTKWGKQAAEAAAGTRKKLVAARKAVLAARQKQIERLELKQALAALDADMRVERSASRKAQLRELKRDIAALETCWQRVIKGLQALLMTMHRPLEELGIDRKGWVLRGGRGGLQVAMGTRNAPPTLMSWSDLGAAPMVRLGEKLLNMKDPADIETLAIGATVAGDFMLAHAMFEALLPLAPERVIELAGYFERAQSGYSSSAEGGAKLRFDRAKKLARQRSFPEAMAIVNELRTELAKNSSLREYLREVNAFRRKTMRRYRIDDDGRPISAFQKKVRKLFGGDVKLDENTGEIEVVYDFEDKAQLRDWIIARQFGQPASKGGWTIMNRKARCLGRDAYLMWKFPVSEWDVQADITYEDTGKAVVVCGGMHQLAPLGAAASIRNGRASNHYYRGFFFGGLMRRGGVIWRAGEAATVRFRPWPGDPGYYLVEINGEFAGYTYDRYDRVAKPGPMAFGFGGGRGTVDNVMIKGVLDLKWFLQYTSRAR